MTIDKLTGESSVTFTTFDKLTGESASPDPHIGRYGTETAEDAAIVCKAFILPSSTNRTRADRHNANSPGSDFHA